MGGDVGGDVGGEMCGGVGGGDIFFDNDGAGLLIPCGIGRLAFWRVIDVCEFES